MFDPDEIREAVLIQNRAYQLIRWLARAIDRGFITFTSAHEYTTDSEAAWAWVREHYHNLPPDCRPPDTSDTAGRRFGNYFASYLNTSFDLRSDPGLELRSRCGCMCWCCTYLAAAPHLKTRKVSSQDKKKAAKLKLDHLHQLSLDLDLRLDQPGIEEIANDRELDQDVSLYAYAAELLSRCAGRPSSPAVLALWRRFAWSRAGSPKPDYVLSSESILKAEARVAHYLRRAAA